MKNLLASLALVGALVVPMQAFAEEGGPALDQAPVNLQDVESLQRGAKLFTNYCLSCHSAQAMRYNRLTDLGLSIDQINANLIFTGDVEDGAYKPTKPGELMKVAMLPEDAKEWFGAAPPDLSVIARAHGADWLYTYLRSFYRDPSRPTGWNNTAFDKVGMPNVLWQLEGDQKLVTVDGDDAPKGAVTRSWQEAEPGKDGKDAVVTHALILTNAGTETELVDGRAKTLDYDATVTDLVNYLVWMGEPAQVTREQIGYGVLIFLMFIFTPLAYFLKREYWRDVH